jgi:hypothetical protein
MNFFFNFFAETETLRSQGPVTRDLCSASDEIHSAYAQPSIKFVPRMLSMDLHVTTAHILPLAEQARKFVLRMLSVR